MNKDQFITAEIEKLAFGGEGILRSDGFVVFVPFTAPGDLVTCRIVSKKKSFARGELVEVLQSSKKRDTPRCPYFGTCGGCQLQHLKYDAQVACKKENVNETLMHIGRLDASPNASIVPSQQQYAYRRHVTLTLVERNGKYEAGYFEIDNRTVLKVLCCPIFIHEDNPVIYNLQNIVREFECPPKSSGKVSILKMENGKFIVQFHFQKQPKNASEVCKKALDTFSDWTGISVNSAKGALTFGNLFASYRIDDLSFNFSPRAFIQNNPEQSLNIYRRICDIAEKLHPQRVLDLYCGVGISSILLANKRMSVYGIEFNAEAVQLAKRNAQQNKMQNVAFLEADVENVIQNTLQSNQFDLVILNPPRTGLADTVRKNLAEHGPQHIVYISCNPATLARDIKDLSSEYYLETCEAFDMFPQTAHVETLVLLKRTK